MEITGRMIQLTPEKRGEGRNGQWVSGGFVIETNEQYPKKIAFTVWGEDRLNIVKNIPLNSTINVVFGIESREYNERWYTDCRATQIQPIGTMPQQGSYQPAQQMQQPPQSQQPNYQTANYQTPTYQTPPQQQPTNNNGSIENSAMPEEKDDDLPF